MLTLKLAAFLVALILFVIAFFIAVGAASGNASAFEYIGLAVFVLAFIVP